MKSQTHSDTTLVVLVAPSVNDSYYASVYQDVIDYFILAANSIIGHDSVIIIADAATMPDLTGQVPSRVLVQANINDIWVRDFSTIRSKNKEIRFDYNPSYLGAGTASWIENSFNNWFNANGLAWDGTSNLKLDGGNFVYNGNDKAIITTKIFDDNSSQTPAQIEATLKSLLNLNEIAFIPPESGDITGHSDGMLMFVDETNLLINTFSEPFRTQVLNEINSSLTGVTITEMPYPYQPGTFGNFASACGIYLNSLVTKNNIYLPQYGLPEDTPVKNTIQSMTSKTVVPIDATNVCYMGGSVRCLTWVVTGQEAETLMGNLGVLPVEISKVEAEKWNDYNLVKWTTESEENTEWHILERRNLEGNWEKLDKIRAKNKGSQSIDYQLFDKVPLSESYYRIKSLDFDDYFQYSKIVSIKRALENELQIEILQNLESNLVTLKLRNGIADNFEILLFNALGQMIQQFNFHHQNKFSETQLEMPFLRNGSYFLKVVSRRNQIEKTQKLNVFR